jgi:hypothetical protein
MTAKEMFEKLGYNLTSNFDIKNIIYDKNMQYRNKKIKCYECYDKKYFDFRYIVFLKNKKILKWNYSHQCLMFITYEEIKAINKQVEELGWNKEK